VIRIQGDLFIGIDPGKSGGVGFIFDRSAVATPMPTTERDIYGLLANMQSSHAPRAIIEKVHSMPKQGVVSSFTFGRNYGFLRGCLVALNISFREVPPQAWQRYLEIPKRKKDETQPQFKRRLVVVAQQMFPHLKLTQKTADAVLIAEYCRRCGG